MTEWRETTDVREVFEALDNGLKVEASDEICGVAPIFSMANGLRWKANRRQVQTILDRQFYIEVKRKEFTGPTVEETPERVAAWRKSCKTIVDQGGCCDDVLCEHCIGGCLGNRGTSCVENGFRSEVDNCKPDPIAKANAQAFLDAHPEPEPEPEPEVSGGLDLSRAVEPDESDLQSKLDALRSQLMTPKAPLAKRAPVRKTRGRKKKA